MNMQYYFYLKNGMTLTVDNIEVNFKRLYMYVEKMVNNKSVITCVCDVPVDSFKFRYMETCKGLNNTVIKHYEEV